MCECEEEEEEKEEEKVGGEEWGGELYWRERERERWGGRGGGGRVLAFGFPSGTINYLFCEHLGLIGLGMTCTSGGSPTVLY